MNIDNIYMHVWIQITNITEREEETDYLKQKKVVALPFFLMFEGNC